LSVLYLSHLSVRLKFSFHSPPELSVTELYNFFFLIYGLSNNLFSCREIYDIPTNMLTKKYVPLMTYVFHVVVDVDLYGAAV